MLNIQPSVRIYEEKNGFDNISVISVYVLYRRWFSRLSICYDFVF